MKRGGWRHLRLRAAFALAPILALTACAKPGPEQVAQSYLLALKTSAYTQCYSLLAAPERSHVTVDAFVAEIPLAPDVTREWFAPIQAATDYRVGAARIEGSTAVVPVNVAMPNLELWQRELGGLTTGARAAAIARQLRDHTYPRLVYTDEIVLVKDHHRWWVSGGFAVRKQVEALREKALAAYHGYDFKLAAELYRQLLALVAEAPFSGSQGVLTHLGRELMVAEASLRNDKQRQAYLSHLVIDKLSRQPTSTSQPGIFGEVRNTGPRSLDQLQLRVTYYLDVDGRRQAVYYEDHTPLARPVEFAGLSPAQDVLRPGGVLRFGFPLKAPAEIQSHAKAVVTADALIFADASAAPPKLPDYMPRQPIVAHKPAASTVASAAAPAAAPSPLPGTASHPHRLRHHRHR